jgi:hypothetical protein
VSETPSAETSVAKPTEAASPSLELWIALGVAAIPQVAAFLFGGYPRLITALPVALTLTFASGAAFVVAGLQLLADRRETRPTHTAVWATMILAAPWIAYALYIGTIALMVHVFCINEVCRGPIR